ncbi:WYL domain-containing protein [Nanchangia anserum]|uniref:WYL domain-containing protein n=1 Tax=Nanchangia anserum TaxID=2692125 RepID=A0A8I0G9Q6_9ACTO|nr:WYL domain-containing protein [Nanchangia anserum]MBD3688798.1 WYL domain-containing protein [Nanchangia anserum]QOX81078.1 WYL domain-containing protein [Nanchangia anserum]
MKDDSDARRRLGLLVALMRAWNAYGPNRQTSRDLIKSVDGYPEDPHEAKRAFETDKRTLRTSYGIDIVTTLDEVFTDTEYYSVEPGSATPDVRFSAVESLLARRAVLMWAKSDRTINPERVLAELSPALASTPDTPTAPDYRFCAGSVLAACARAIDRRCAISFTYVARTGTKATRHVEPWTLAQANEQFYLRGFDRDRGEARTFRIARIHSAITSEAVEGSYTIPDDVGDLFELPLITPRVRLPRGTHAPLRMRATGEEPAGPDHIECTLQPGPADEWRATLLAAGPDVDVVSPASLRADVAEAWASLEDVRG